jgi:hypothetical protein
LATLPISNDLNFLQKQRAKILFWNKGFLNYLFIKLMGINSLIWSHYFTKPLFYKPLISGIQKLLRELDKGDVYFSDSFWKHLLNLYSLIWNSFQLHHGMIPMEHLSRPFLSSCLLHEFDYDWLCLTWFDSHLCSWLFFLEKFLQSLLLLLKPC